MQKMDVVPDWFSFYVIEAIRILAPAVLTLVFVYLFGFFWGGGGVLIG